MKEDIQILKKGNIIKKIITLTPSEGKAIKKDQVKKVFDKLSKNRLITMKVLFPIGWRTITKNGHLNFKDEDDYYDGRVKVKTKFEQIFGLQVYTFEEAKKKK